MTTEDSTRLATLRAGVAALADLQTILKPYTASGTKLRLPRDVGDGLHALEDALREPLSEVHHEGTHYDYQDEAAAPMTDDERFLGMIVVASLKDRLHAMKLRQEGKLAEAITYLGECTITEETESEQSLGARLNADEQQVVYAIQGVSMAMAQEIHQTDYDEDKARTMLAGLAVALETLANTLPAKL